ncbi:substrate-binding domain-containing protein [Mesorhizobium sp.]|uniref:substrate-binding domain-containing protein n=1 Tax=Mesorhizobium sp. TaxID=1871066 RepID=UPI0025F33A79|nr:substrate-binding domain-containing protein [Mesorhizobium sp.]
MKIGWLPKLDTDPYFQVAGDGALEAAKEIGGEIVRLAPSQATAEAQVEIVNNLVSQGVKIIALSSNDANAIAPALKARGKAGRQNGHF